MSSKILCAIPCVVDGGQLRRAIECVIHKPDVSVLVIDNSTGIDKSVSIVLLEYSERVYVIQNPENRFVNFAWNQAILYFLESPNNYDYLIIMNSDITLQGQWDMVCRNRWEIDSEEILIPTIAEPREVETKVLEGQDITGGVAGIFITISRDLAKEVYPLPDDKIKVWYGDNWIQELAIARGQRMTIVPNLLCEHEESSSVRKVPGVYYVIECDKLNWKNVVKPELDKKIDLLKTNKTTTLA